MPYPKLLGGLVLALAGCSMLPGNSPQMAPAKSVDGVLTGMNGMTLYTFDRDVAESGKSVCNGPCATNWPPLAAGADSRMMGPWGVVTRDDGTKQWSYQGKPLYFWTKDQKPGDKTGDGFMNVWKTAKP